jgi:hypothetical protein
MQKQAVLCAIGFVERDVVHVKQLPEGKPGIENMSKNFDPCTPSSYEPQTHTLLEVVTALTEAQVHNFFSMQTVRGPGVLYAFNSIMLPFPGCNRMFFCSA